MSIGVIPAAAARRVLDDRRGTRAMMWIMAIMLFLTVLAAAFGLGTVNAAQSIDRQLAGRLTVQIVDADPAKRDAATRKVLDAIKLMPTVSNAQVVGRDRLAALLRPWLGDAATDVDVPIPTLIDIDMVVASDESAQRVAAGVRGASASARVDTQSRWLSPVADFMRTLTYGALGLVLLIVTATMAVVLLAARAGLETHRDTIAILHMLGSTDVQVARLFQRRIALDTLIGGVIGTVVAMLIVWLGTSQVAQLGSDLLGGGALGQRDWLVLALLPLLFAGVATVAARVAVLQRLRMVQ